MSEPEFQPIPPDRDEEAANILAAASFEGAIERGRDILAEARAAEDARIRGMFLDDRLVAAYILRKTGMANEISHIAVAPDHRRQGYGRSCLVDAVKLSGKRPLVAETDDEALGFYKACGFKLIGRRRHPSGAMRYRLGWHMPGLRRPVPDRGGDG
ncbi:MAG: GNAT family N-acetyltransferase [Thermomicrobiales bacterium]